MVKGGFKIHYLNMLDYNSCLIRRYRNESIYDVIQNFTLIRTIENDRSTIYVCKEVKFIQIQDFHEFGKSFK